MMDKQQLEPTLPSIGMAFAFPLENGRFSVCRVIRKANHAEIKQFGGEAILVGCSSWIGDQIPLITIRKLRSILKLSHHSWSGEQQVLWISNNPPRQFTPLGIIKPSLLDKLIKCHSFGSWENLQIQPLMQWRWDNEREEVLLEDELANRKSLKENESMALNRKNLLKSISLLNLQKYHFFTLWKDYPPQESIEISRNIMSSTVEALLSLDENAPDLKKISFLQECIERFNIANEKSRFIETVEREDICEEFELIVYASGLEKYKDLADKWRDW